MEGGNYVKYWSGWLAAGVLVISFTQHSALLCIMGRGGSLEADHRFLHGLRPQLPHPLADDGVAAVHAAGPQLLVDADRRHVRIALQELADEEVVLIQHTRPRRRLRQSRRRRRARAFLLRSGPARGAPSSGPPATRGQSAASTSPPGDAARSRCVASRSWLVPAGRCFSESCSCSSKSSTRAATARAPAPAARSAASATRDRHASTPPGPDSGASSPCRPGHRAGNAVAGPGGCRPGSAAVADRPLHAFRLQQCLAWLLQDEVLLLRTGPAQQIDDATASRSPSATRAGPPASTAGWLPTGNRVNCRASVGGSRPSRSSALASSHRRSSSASRRQTQLLCCPSNSAACTCVRPSSRTRACTSHASSSSLGCVPMRLSP